MAKHDIESSTKDLICGTGCFRKKSDPFSFEILESIRRMPSESTIYLMISRLGGLAEFFVTRLTFFVIRCR